MTAQKCQRARDVEMGSSSPELLVQQCPLCRPVLPKAAGPHAANLRRYRSLNQDVRLVSCAAIPSYTDHSWREGRSREWA